MTEILPHRHGMNLGKTYDLRNHSIGEDIFPEEYTSNPETLECPLTEIKYSVVRSCSDVNKLLSLSGDISLKVKAGVMHIQGIESYLKEIKSEEKSLEILAAAHVETISTRLKNPQPVANWNKGKLGTHYINSVIYGGDLVVSIRIIASDSKHLEEIKAKVNSGLHAEGILNDKTKDNMRKMEQELNKSSEIKLSYYCTTPGTELPRNVASMLNALDDFQSQLKKTNDEKGVPLRCELVPFTQLVPSDVPSVNRQKGLETQLTELEEAYDEIRQANSMLKNCMEDATEHMTDEQGEKATTICNRFEQVISKFNIVISKLDVTTDGDQIQQALDYYRNNKRFGSFRAEVKKFITSVQPHISNVAFKKPVKDLPPGEPLSIVLLGKTGHGKSATANSIFGEEKFHSKMSANAVSNKCQREIGIIGGRDICLVDTPGTLDTTCPDVALKELGTAIAFQPGGFHAFVFILSIHSRITPEEQMAITLLKNMFGDDVIKQYGVFVFTHGDTYTKINNKQKVQTTYRDYIESQGGYITSILEECDKRYTMIDNFESDPGILRDQVIGIITLIDDLVKKNGGKTYTNHRFETAQKKLKYERERVNEKHAVMRNEMQELRLSAMEEQNGDSEIRIQSIDEQMEHQEQQIEAEVANLAHVVGEQIAIEAKEEGIGCFPPNALVTLDDGTTIAIADVRTGHKVLSSTSSGTLEYSEVYFFAHLNPNAMNKYIKLRSATKSLKLTPDHHIYIVRQGHLKTFAAREVKIGDKMLVLNGKFSFLAEEPIMEISESIEVGVYAPITILGSIIVNNVLASCYVDIFPPVYSHLMLWPIRQLYRISPSFTARINAEGKEGMPGWVQWIMENLLV